MSTGNHNLDSILGGKAHFLTTHWSVVIRAGQDPSEASQQALADLCRTYWYPLYAFVRRQGHGPQEAEDLTQEFFARLLEKNYVAGADQQKGRFRTFLIVALKHFLANEWDRQHAQKRGGFQTVVSIDHDLAESRYGAELAHHEQPDVIFERQWAVTLLEEVMTRLQAEYTATDRTCLFDHLRPCLTKDESALPYTEIGQRIGLTEAAVKMAVQRLRNRYRELLRDEIGRTVTSPDEVEEEIEHLFSVFA